MANIPVEKTGTNWLPWILGLLALALIGFFIFLAADDPDNDEDTVVVDDTEVVTPVAGLDMDDLYVTRVVGDNTFFVAPTEGGTDETLVYLEEEAEAGNGVEGRYDVTAGQHISVTGEMMDTPADLTPWGLTTEQAAMVGPQYVRATRLTVLDEDTVLGEDVADRPEAAGLAMLDGDLSAMAGQAIALDAVRVTGLTGDSTFAVGEGAQRTVVVLESLGEGEDGPGDGSDGRFDVNMGDVVDIDGTVMAFRRGMRGTTDMSETDQTGAEARRFVIVINSADGFSKR